MEDTIERRIRGLKNGGKEKFGGRIMASKMLLNRVKGRNGEN